METGDTGDVPLVHGRIYDEGRRPRYGTASAQRLRLFAGGHTMRECMAAYPGRNGGRSGERARHVLRQDMQLVLGFDRREVYEWPLDELRVQVARALREL